MKRSTGIKNSNSNKKDKHKRSDRVHDRKREAATQEAPRLVIMTHDHINRGGKGNVTQCPIGLALSETLHVDVRVSPTGIKVSDNLTLAVSLSLIHI